MCSVFAFLNCRHRPQDTDSVSHLFNRFFLSFKTVGFVPPAPVPWRWSGPETRGCPAGCAAASWRGTNGIRPMGCVLLSPRHPRLRTCPQTAGSAPANPGRRRGRHTRHTSPSHSHQPQGGQAATGRFECLPSWWWSRISVP